MDFELYEVGPTTHPLIERIAVGCFHDLIALRQVVGHPARDVVQTVRRHAAAFPKTPIHGYGIPFPEMFDDQVRLRHMRLSLGSAMGRSGRLCLPPGAR